MSTSTSPKSLIEITPDSICLNFDDELKELLAASANPVLNLSLRNYEWVVSAAFDTLREDSDQSYKQADFVVTVVNVLFPNVKLLQSFGTYDLISGILDRTIRELYDRLKMEGLYHNHLFPYTPVTYLSPTQIVFDYKPDALPFVFKGVNLVKRGQ